MGISRRGFLLGASNLGVLAVLPKSLILPVKEDPVEKLIQENVLDAFSHMRLVNLGGLRCVPTSVNDGVYFGGKIIETSDLTFTMYNTRPFVKTLDSTNLFDPLYLPEYKLEVNQARINMDSYDAFVGREKVEVDICAQGRRYTGDFIIESFEIGMA